MGFKRIRRGLWCLGLAGMLSGSALALSPQLVQAQTKEQTATAHKAIAAAYKAEDVAFTNSDIEGSMQSHAPNFVAITKSGKRYTREEAKQMLALLLKNAENISCNTVIERITLQGNRANVQIKTYTRMNLIDRSGAKRVFVGNEQRADSWIKQNGKWLRTQGKQMSSTVTLDGKPVG